MKKRDELDEFGDRLKATQLAISNEMLRKGHERYRASIIGAIGYLLTGGFIAVIAVLFYLHWVFYIFAAVLLVATIRMWLNARDMERFIEAVNNDIAEIQK